MPIEIGQIEALFRYPVKSMRGEQLEAVTLGWHGLEGDRRFAFRRLDDGGDFPWLSASRLPGLVCFTPLRGEPGKAGAVPTHVRTPEGEEMPLFGEALAAEVTRRCGVPVQMMQLRNGIFDEATVSVISSTTAGEICRLAKTGADIRRFRPNIVVRCTRALPFEEDQWVGGVLRFGEGGATPAVAVTMRDLRCAMVNIEPDRGTLAPEMMKACVHSNENHAGIYGTVIRPGRLAVGQTVVLHQNAPATA